MGKSFIEVFCSFWFYFSDYILWYYFKISYNFRLYFQVFQLAALGYLIWSLNSELSYFLAFQEHRGMLLSDFKALSVTLQNTNKEWDKNLQEVQKEKSVFLHNSPTAPKIKEENDHTNDSLTYPNGEKSLI